MSDAYAGRYWNTVTNTWESASGFTGSPRAQLWAWQPSSLSLQPVTMDNTGALVTSATLSGSAGNAAASATGAGVPTAADYIGWNNAGTLVGVSTAAPLPVTVVGGGGGSSASVGATGGTTPTSADLIGFNAGGTLLGVGLGSPLPVNMFAGGSAVTLAAPMAVQPGTGITFTVAYASPPTVDLLNPVNQGNPNTFRTSAWWVKLTNGSNDLTITPSGGAAGPTDTAVVVAAHPNSVTTIAGMISVATGTYSSDAGTVAGSATLHTTTGGKTLELFYYMLNADPVNAGPITVTLSFTSGAPVTKVSLVPGAILARNVGAGKYYLAGAVGDNLLVSITGTGSLNWAAEFKEV